MCRFWKKEQCNHHFPELNRRQRIFSLVGKLFNIKKAAVLLTIAAIAFGFAYLAQANASAGTGYKIQELEQQVSRLKEENKKLNLKYVELQSMANIIDQVGALHMVAAGELEILNSAGSSVALR